MSGPVPAIAGAEASRRRSQHHHRRALAHATGVGWLGHTFAAYGMGNFLWWERSYSTATGVLKLTLHPHAPLTATIHTRSRFQLRPADR